MMKRAARFSLQPAIGLVPLLGYSDSRNMAAQIDSEESGGERTLQRSSGGAMTERARGRGTAIVHSGPHWRGIHDENGRLTVAINFNMDLGDAWEHADNPGYPQPLTALAYRYAINDLLSSMSH